MIPLGGLETERTSRLLAEERSLLETASVAGAGPTFSAIDLADNRDGVEAAERQLEHFARNRRFIIRADLSHRPDGRYAFQYVYTTKRSTVAAGSEQARHTPKDWYPAGCASHGSCGTSCFVAIKSQLLSAKLCITQSRAGVLDSTGVPGGKGYSSNHLLS